MIFGHNAAFARYSFNWIREYLVKKTRMRRYHTTICNAKVSNVSVNALMGMECNVSVNALMGMECNVALIPKTIGTRN